MAEFKPTTGRSDGIDRDLIRHHFDSVHFCEDFTVGHEMKEPVIKSFTTMKKTAFQDLDVIRCVAAVEVMALPHNIMQDFRWYFTTFSLT